MQSFTHSRYRRTAGQGGAYADGAMRLAQAYRAQGFSVAVLPVSGVALANVPDVVLLLTQGHAHTLVHGYARQHGALGQGAVQQLAADRFEAGANRAVLIGAGGFTVAAHQAALRHGQLELVDDQAMASLLDADAVFAGAPGDAIAPRLTSLRDATRPAWPLRAAIGMGGVAMAVTMVFASMPALQGKVLDALGPARSSDIAFAQAAAESWQAPAQSRSGALDLQAPAESGLPVRPAAYATTDGLPANFNQSLAPRL